MNQHGPGFHEGRLTSLDIIYLLAPTPSARSLQFHQLRCFLHLRFNHLDEAAVCGHDLGTLLQVLDMAGHNLVEATETKNNANQTISVKNKEATSDNPIMSHDTFC